MPDETDTLSLKDQKAEELERAIAKQAQDDTKKYDPKLMAEYSREMRELEQLSADLRDRSNALKGAYATLRKKYRELGLDVPNVDLALKSADRIKEISAPQPLVWPLLLSAFQARGYSVEDTPEDEE